jgi:hypothetical protein
MLTAATAGAGYAIKLKLPVILRSASGTAMRNLDKEYNENSN